MIDRATSAPRRIPFVSPARRALLGLVALGSLAAGCDGSGSNSDDDAKEPTAPGSGAQGSNSTGGTQGEGAGNGSGSSGGAPASGGAPGTGGDPATWAPAFCADLRTSPNADEWQSTEVYYERDRLVYSEDEEHNSIADFSYAGYHYGEVEPPEVAEAAFLAAESGDQTARIQAALDEVAERPLDEFGFRGALVLGPGEFRIEGTLRLDASGVVLRGAGDGSDPASNTILLAPGDEPHHRSVVELGTGSGADFDREVAGSRTSLAETAWTGARRLLVEDASGFSVGDPIVIRHPSTSEWIEAVDGDQASPAWEAGSLDMVFRRRVLGLAGNEIELDAPVFDHLNLALSNPYVFKVEVQDLVSHVGIESLRIDIETSGPEDEDHAAHGVTIEGAEDAWVRDVTALHFYYAAVRALSSVRVTVDDVFALDPVSEVDGGRRYNFSADREAQLLLVKNSHASNGRHHFVSNGTTTVSGIVFYNSVSEAAYTSSEGHRRWSQGMLFDNLREENGRETRVFGFYNRGDWGTSHWWSNTQSVAWNLDPGNGSAVFQKPPTGQNWAIGGRGTITGDGPFDGPPGFLEQKGRGLMPHSLYLAQLCERFWTDALIAKAVGLPPHPSGP